METSSLSTAIAQLQEHAAAHGGQLPEALLDEAGRQVLALCTLLGSAVQHSPDPRLIAAHASNVEALFRFACREQLSIAVQAETTAAHTLALEEYEALREGATDFATEPVYASGRTCYRQAADFLAAWLGIDYFEAQRRVNDAHLVVGRRTMEGNRCAPRFEHLGEHYKSEPLDPRQVVKAARALEKLEPADEIFNGVPTPLTATAADGRTLEEHTVTILISQEPRTAQRQLTALLTDYKKANLAAAQPELGIFKRPALNGVDQYLVRVQGAEAGLFRSLIAQADNWRTQAGAAARTGQSPDPAPLPFQVPADPATPSATGTGVPPWLQTDQPPPDWAVDPESAPALAAPDLDATEPEETRSPDQPREPVNTVPVKAGPAESEPDASVVLASGVHVPVALRRLNALTALLKQRSTGTPGTVKTVAPELVVHLQVDDLQHLATTHGVTAHGVKLEPGQLRHLLCEAKIIPMVFNGKGQVLDVGRSQRIFPPAIKKAIIARDRGCIVPGCTTPPELVEAHHYKEPWAGGGWTSADNGAAVCPLEHAAHHAGFFQIVEHNGLPHVILPKHIDPEQKPRRNQYWNTT